MENQRKKPVRYIKRLSFWLLGIGILAILAVCGYFLLRPAVLYSKADTLFAQKVYRQAAENFRRLGDYRDAEVRKLICLYEEAAAAENAGEYVKAEALWLDLGEYEDAADRSVFCGYSILAQRVDAADWTVRQELLNFRDAYGDYRDTAVLLHRCDYGIAVDALAAKAYTEAILGFTALGAYKDAPEQLQQARYEWAAVLDAQGDLSLAAEQYSSIENYKDAALLKKDILYRQALASTDYLSFLFLADLGNYREAIEEVQARCLPDLSHAVTLAAGKNHLARLGTDGTVRCTGTDTYGQCDTASWTEVVSLAVGDFHTVGLRRDGTVVAVGENAQHQCDVSDWRNVIYITAGAYVTAGITADGKLLMTDTRLPGMADILLEEAKVIDVAIGYDHITVLTGDGRVVSAGANSYKQLKSETITDCKALYATDFTTYVLHNSGTVSLIGADGGIGKEIAAWKDIVSLCCSMGLVAGLRADGHVLAAGRNDRQQMTSESFSGICSVATNGRYILGVLSDGSVTVTGGESPSWDPIRLWKQNDT